MNYLSAESLSKSYGTKVLFENITFGINKGQKIALVAKNGTGKSSLLKILVGKDIADKGTVTLRKGIRVAYLDQDPELDPESTVLETLFNTDTPALQAIKEYEACLDESESGAEVNLQRLENATNRMDAEKAWDYEVVVKQILSQLKVNHFNQPVNTLSGGQRKRVALAQALINNPDLLIMDEPTNHLDIEMIEWLENYISGRDLTLLLVTHDRYFLDRICDEIIEMDNGHLHNYKGNFSYYIEKKAEREISDAAEIDKARNIYRRELEWVRRMPKARGTKSKSRLDAFDRVSEKAKQKKTEQKLELNVKTNRLGGKILELIKLSKSYDALPILKSFSYTFKKNEKIGIVGKNGVGKSTFLRLIMGLEKADAGKIQTGETVIFGYYSQDGLVLNEDKRVIEVVKDIAEVIPLADGSKLSASQLLQRFQFPPDLQYNFVSKLSGGEKRKLYLLTVLMKNPNFLILDEPTNDLDIITLGILEEFLTHFQGCVLIVSHDRYFMDKLVDHLFVFEGDGVVKDFPGNYTIYREKQLAEKKQQKKDVEAKAQPEKQKKSIDANAGAKRKPSYKEKYEYEQLEKEIEVLEKRKEELEAQLNSGTDNHEQLQTWSEELGQVMSELDQKSDRWLELAELMN